MQFVLLMALVFQAPDTSLVHAAQQALQTTPIEAFDSATGATTVSFALELDLDGDGTNEIAAALRPAFRQTPTLIFFRRTADGTLSRIVEGLAPGPLTPLSGRLKDSHTQRVGVDMTPDPGPKPLDTLAFVRIAMAQKFSVVVYRTFFHMDMRNGTHFLIRETNAMLPHPDDQTCEGFQFSPIEGMAYGTYAGSDTTKYLAVQTQGELTLYHFSGVETPGWLLQTSETIRIANLAEVVTLPTGQIGVRAHGRLYPVERPR